jgi:TolB-like protein/tetratricopeptide (TPR) repeat protein/tRNA A-37 threonylcarbamoyl transferase component Bud32
LIGRTLGHYRIVDRLGSGGMGVVWLAEDLTLKRRVALKMLRQDLASSPEKLARFEREAKAVAALNHPAIVTLHAIEEADGVRFLVMEYVEGRTLDELIPADGLPLPELLRIAIPVADALAAAHAGGVTHRDLKPSNVLVGGDGRVKVLDFGLAKLHPQEATAVYGREPLSTLTQEGTVVGTLHYMSPEQLQLKHIDHRSDLFAFGVLLYEMATGELPFRGESAAQVITAVLRDEPRQLERAEARLPADVVDLMRACLEKDVGRRLASAAEARDRLKAVAHGLETGQIQAGASRLRRLVGRVRRRTPPATLASGAALVVALVAIPFVLRTVQRGAVAAPATPPASASVVVLPLADYSDDPEYFVDGMTDGLIGALARLGGLRVISRQSAMHYKHSDKRVPEIARELGVDYVVEASVARDGDRLRIQAQLVRPDPEQQLWSKVFERPATDVLALHNQVARAVATALDVPVSAAEERQMSASKSVDPAVYEAYLQGRYWGGKFSQEDLLKAKGYYQRAIALDPAFAPAWAGLGDVLIWLSHYYEKLEPSVSEAEAAARRALQLDGGLADAYATLADVAQSRWQWQTSEEEIQRAIALDPNSSWAHRTYWHLLAPRLQFEQARREIETAARLDPLSAQIQGNLGMELIFEKRWAEAETVLRHALELDPDYTIAHGWLWNLYTSTGKDPERGIELGRYLEVMGYPDVLPEYQRRLASGGYDAALSWVATDLATRERGQASRVGVIGGLLAEAGRTEEALDWLRFGLEHRVWEMPWLAVSPDYRRLHGNPEYNRLLDQLGLPHPES